MKWLTYKRLHLENSLGDVIWGHKAANGAGAGLFWGLSSYRSLTGEGGGEGCRAEHKQIQPLDHGFYESDIDVVFY